VTTDEATERKVEWRATPRPWSYGYENGAERFGEAMTEIRKELGFDTTEAFSEWIYEKTTELLPDGRVMGLGGQDVPPPLLDAFEFPCIGWGSMYYVIDALAEALEVSPGTLIDELWLRASNYSEAGDSLEEA
jgi:hypothetical protein